MIDGLKISTTKFNVGKLLYHPELDFVSLVNTDTGDIKYNKHGTLRKFASFQGLKFILIENASGNHTLEIVGSIHKYFNNGNHNYNDFSYQNIQFVLNDLEQRFGLKLNACYIHNIEFGVNIIPPIETIKILKGLLSHRTTPFKRISMDSADYYQAKHKNYYFIKIYDKAKQFREKGFKIKKETLRIELKYVKMENIIRLLKKRGLINRNVLTLQDLYNINVLHQMGVILLEKWKEILFYDPTIFIKYPNRNQKLQLANYSNPLFWEKLNKRKRYREKQKLKDITDKHSKGIQSQIHTLIKNKLDAVIPKMGPFEVSDKAIKTSLLAIPENKEVGLIESISKEVIGRQKKIKVPPEEIEVFIPNYEEWINDPRSLPF